MPNKAFIVDAVRTPIGKRGGALSTVHPVDLLAAALHALMSRCGIDSDSVGDHIAGCVGQTGPQSYNIGRWGWLAAGFSERVPSMTIDRQCGSSQQAIHSAAEKIMAGTADIVVASGVESMSHVPIGASLVTLSPSARERLQGIPILGKRLRGIPLPAGRPFTSPALRIRYEDRLVPQGLSAELIAEQWGISRDACDSFSHRSHVHAAEATAQGFFREQVVALNGLEQDEGIRQRPNLEKMATLRPAFRKDGVITAANSSQVSDGAGAVLLMSERALRWTGLSPRAQITALDVVGSDPIMMLTGPITATKRVLNDAFLPLSMVDVVEINEAFAPVVLAWQEEMRKEYRVDAAWFEERVNPNGGAIAHGHPLGATGAILMTKLINELERSGGRYGLQTMCEGGGMANATLIERV